MFEIKCVMTRSMTDQSAQIIVTTSWMLPYPPNVLRQKQLEDPDIAPIIKWKERKRGHLGWKYQLPVWLLGFTGSIGK